MKGTFRRVGAIALALGLLIAAVELAALVAPGAPRFLSEAGAVVGRPLTPVSVAGVGRRTARRCAAGVYDC